MFPAPVVRVGLAALLLALSGCGKDNAAPGGSAPPVPVDVQSVQSERFVPVERLVGKAAPSRVAEVRARVEGIVLSREYHEGSDVEADALLFRIDPAPLQAELNEADARLQRAQAELHNAEALARRLSDLHARGLAAAQARDDAEAAQRIAKAEWAEAEAARQRAALELSWTSVRAPIAGRAGRAEVTEGALVGADGATVLTRIEQIDPLYVDASVPAADWPALREVLAATGAPTVQIQGPNGEDLADPGTVEFADLAADPRTGVIALRATVPNPARRILPGMYVHIFAELPAIENAILIDAASVLRDARGSYVYVYDAESNTAQRRDIELGPQVGPRWRVRDGLSGGEQLISSSLQRLRPGAAVKLAEQAAP